MLSACTSFSLSLTLMVTCVALFVHAANWSGPVSKPCVDIEPSWGTTCHDIRILDNCASVDGTELCRRSCQRCDHIMLKHDIQCLSVHNSGLPGLDDVPLVTPAFTTTVNGWKSSAIQSSLMVVDVRYLHEGDRWAMNRCTELSLCDPITSPYMVWMIGRGRIHWSSWTADGKTLLAADGGSTRHVELDTTGPLYRKNDDNEVPLGSYSLVDTAAGGKWKDPGAGTWSLANDGDNDTYQLPASLTVTTNCGQHPKLFTCPEFGASFQSRDVLNMNMDPGRIISGCATGSEIGNTDCVVSCGQSWTLRVTTNAEHLAKMTITTSPVSGGRQEPRGIVWECGLDQRIDFDNLTVGRPAWMLRHSDVDGGDRPGPLNPSFINMNSPPMFWCANSEIEGIQLGSGGYNGVCEDKRNSWLIDNGVTCPQLSQWNQCDADWMTGLCSLTCRRCPESQRQTTDTGCFSIAAANAGQRTVEQLHGRIVHIYDDRWPNVFERVHNPVHGGVFSVVQCNNPRCTTDTFNRWVIALQDTPIQIVVPTPPTVSSVLFAQSSRGLEMASAAGGSAGVYLKQPNADALVAAWVAAHPQHPGAASLSASLPLPDQVHVVTTCASLPQVTCAALPTLTQPQVVLHGCEAGTPSIGPKLVPSHWYDENKAMLQNTQQCTLGCAQGYRVDTKGVSSELLTRVTVTDPQSSQTRVVIGMRRHCTKFVGIIPNKFGPDWATWTDPRTEATKAFMFHHPPLPTTELRCVVDSDNDGSTCSDTRAEWMTHTCAEHKAWGQCNESWLAGLCEQTCERCSTSPSPTCSDTRAEWMTHTCAEHKAWGQCNESWLAGLCEQSCDRCPANQRNLRR